MMRDVVVYSLGSLRRQAGSHAGLEYLLTWPDRTWQQCGELKNGNVSINSLLSSADFFQYHPF